MKIKLNDKVRWFAKNIETGEVEEFTDNLYWFEEYGGLQFEGDQLSMICGKYEVWIEVYKVEGLDGCDAVE